MWYSILCYKSEIGQRRDMMQAEEAQLQYMHLYKKMDAVYYQMAIA